MNRPESLAPNSSEPAEVSFASFKELVGRHPPRPRLAFNIGITGHRAALLPEDGWQALRPAVDEVFGRLQEAVHRLHLDPESLFDTVGPIIRLHTPLATGADQLAAESARSHGFRVRALLPFAPDVYRNDFEEGRERAEFDRQLGAAAEFFALPCERSDGDGAYVQVGKAVIAASDVMVAIWDGRAGNGPGGTAHVVELALDAGVPVIHIQIDLESGRVADARLLDGLDVIDLTSEPLDETESYSTLVRKTLAPHSEFERKQILQFYGEREKLNNWRLEFSFLLALLGVKPLPRKPWRQSSIADDIRHDWEGVPAADPPGAREPLARAYGWANFLGIRYAQLFRSGHVTNYFLSTLAVILALTGLLLPKAKVLLVLAELTTIGLLYLNTQSGRNGEWHRRWLQYRHLAESLRPLIYLKRTGIISTPFRTDIVRGPMGRETGADWTHWYAAAIWRQMDSPRGVLDQALIRELSEAVVREQITPQANYHHTNAKRMHKLDHRLHEIGNFLMGAVIASCVLYVAGYFVLHEWVVGMTNIFIVLTAGLPAIGAAVFGLRGHGEHLLTASRSKQTALSLEKNAARLVKTTRLEPVASELQSTAAIMLADLNEWTLAYRERSLEVPA
jgi:hypothetical protein